jgi:N-acetylmuramic acid 6-phosphate etherase
MDYSKLPTEMQNPKTRALDRLSIQEILRVMDEEDQRVPMAVKKVNLKMAQAVQLIVHSLRKGGRLVLAGAGTSGRLGVLEASECPPTFNTPPHLVQAVMAGGRGVVFCSKEGAEDRTFEARKEAKKRVRKGDVVIGISASGVTAFVQAFLEESKRRGARTILVACNLASRLRHRVDVVVAPRVGPEVIAGSTRLKAGTATKLILNRLTVASMVQLGKVYGNLMVDLQPRSKKLRARAQRIVKHLAGISDQTAKRLLREARGRAKVAILMAKKNLTYRKAVKALQKTDGVLRKVL